LKSAFIAAFVVLLAAGQAVAAETLRFGGTGSAIELLRQVGAEFTGTTGVKVVVYPSLGSAGAIRALADGKLDIAVSARPLNADESPGGLTQVMAVRTPYVLATSHPNPNGLKAADLPGIFSDSKATWADGTPIRIILRPRSEADNALLGQFFDGMEQAIEAARGRSEVPIAATDQDNAALAERMPGSLAGTTATQLKTERHTLKIVPLDGIEPTLPNFESGAYRFAKKLYFIVKTNGNPDARRFMEFLRSPQELKVLREAEILPDVE
jgi:phosphate transport system substrate-binding protein